MAKKNLNPADAFRKAQRKKELKKNKTERNKARDFALVKKNTWDIEDEIQKLESANNPSDKQRLADLKVELEKVNKKKAEYVAEHPEHRRLVYRPRPKDGDPATEEIILPKRNLFNKKGLPRHPERSIFYDPVMNPFGVAPPGMSYAERPPRPEEVWSDEDSDDEDEDIAMPEGSPPVVEREGGGDDDLDDIPMPDGPSPAPSFQAPFSPPLPTEPPPTDFLPPTSLSSNVPPLPDGFANGKLLPLPPPPPLGLSYPLPPNFPPHIFPNFLPSAFLSHPLPSPPPPPGFFPRRNQSASAIQDPLSSTPHQTFQAHQEKKQILLVHPSLPLKPTQPATGLHTPPASFPGKPSTERSAEELVAATVFAAPQLRDFRKEATAFVPASLKRKKAAASSKVNAAPGMDESVHDSSVPARPDLLNALKDRFGPAAPHKLAGQKGEIGEKKKSDYDNFLAEMSDILGPTK